MLAMRKKGIPEILVRSVMSLYETRVRVDSELTEEIEFIMGIHQWSVLSPFLFALMVDVITDIVLLYAYDLVMMSEIIVGLRDKFLKWTAAFESKDLKDNHGKTKVVVSSSITQDGLCTSKVDPCGVCSLRVKAYSVLCL